MDDFWTLVRFLHVLAATMWVGGMLFLGLVAVPVALKNPDPAERRSLITAVAKRFGYFGAVAWVMLLVTGFGLIDHRGLSLADLPDTGYGRRILAKIVLLILVGVIAVLHGMWQGPRVRRAEAAGDERATRRWKAAGGIMDGMMLIGSLAALWLAVSLIA
jgi:uncharacterized membrane protein